MKPADPPLNAPMSAAGVRFAESRSAISTPITDPIMAGMMMTITIARAITNAIPIFMVESLSIDASLATKGYFRPLTSPSESLLV